jgi:hypothetical protein
MKISRVNSPSLRFFGMTLKSLGPATERDPSCVDPTQRDPTLWRDPAQSPSSLDIVCFNLEGLAFEVWRHLVFVWHAEEIRHLPSCEAFHTKLNTHHFVIRLCSLHYLQSVGLVQ